MVWLIVKDKYVGGRGRNDATIVDVSVLTVVEYEYVETTDTDTYIHTYVPPFCCKICGV